MQYAEDAESLKESGVHTVYNLYEAAGAGFVDHVIKELLDSPPELVPGSVVASSDQPNQSAINDTTSESPS